MKKLFLFLSFSLILTCAKEDSQAPNTPPSQITMQYTLTVSAGDGGSVEGQGVYNEGTKVTIAAAPNNCYTFTGWSDGNIDNPRTITLDSDLKRHKDRPSCEISTTLCLGYDNSNISKCVEGSFSNSNSNISG